MKWLFALLISLSVMAADKAKNPVVVMETSMGTIEIELDQEKAPITVANFLKYVDKKFYNGTIFHRVIDGFMIQGGGFDAKMKEKSTDANIKNEAGNGLKNEVGTIAMARTPDPHSASSQFFINVAKNDFLNYTAPTQAGFGYAVFGKVINGMHVVDRIKKLKTGSKAGHENVPMDVVTIKSVKRK